MLAQLSNVSLSFPDKKVLEDVSLTVYPGDSISLVGENGAGKTSLFRMLGGRLAPDSGEVSLARGARVGYLEQDFAGMDEDPKRSCMDAALEPFGPLIELEKDMERLSFELAKAGEKTSELLADLGEAQHRFEGSGGYEFRARAESTLAGLGLPEPLWERGVSGLSAGQRMRLALARLLLEEHDLVLFDEPTNHLDIPAREWLEGHLAGMNAAYVVASHDRRFLNAVSGKVAHLDRGRLTVYPGDYTAFRHQLEQAEEEGWRRYEKSRKLAKKLQRRAQEYQRWSEAGEKKKRGAADKGFVSHKAAKLMKRSLAARRRMEEAVQSARTEKPYQKDAVKIEFGSSRGRNLLRVGELVVGYSNDRPLTGGLSFELSAGDRVAILGPNGCGKTALLRTVLGEVSPLPRTSGTSTRTTGACPRGHGPRCRPRDGARRDLGQDRHGEDGRQKRDRKQEGGQVELGRARQSAIDQNHPGEQQPPRPRRANEPPRHRDPGRTPGGAGRFPGWNTLRLPRPLLRGTSRNRDPDTQAKIRP